MPDRSQRTTVKELTDAELLVLGLVAEMPRRGYELEQVIEQRAMREWTQVAFSSIYFVLGKLEKMGLVTAKAPFGAKAKKVYSVTRTGRRILVAQTITELKTVRSMYSSVLLGMVNWPALERGEGQMGKDYVEPPLEGLWWADDVEDLVAGNKDKLKWR